MAAPSSVTKTGRNEPWELQVSRGQISWHKPLFKYGANPDINGSLETIWSQGGIYAYPAAASVMKVSSSSTDDASSGTGARTVAIYGLDANYNEIDEIVSLDGQTQVNTVKSYLRVFRAFVVTAGSGGTAAGTIYIGTGTATLGVPATTYAAIPLGDNQTMMAMWTVPAGYTAYMLGGKFSASSNNDTHTALGKFLFRPYGGVFRNAADVTLNNGFANFNFILPLAIPEKSDIETRAIALSGSNFYVTASFEVLYIKNDASTP
jgi:hypothetical protein